MTKGLRAGEILRDEFLKPHGFSPSSFAKSLGVPHNRITSIVNGTRRISPETAILLSAAFGTTELFWLNLQIKDDLDDAKESISIGQLSLAIDLRMKLMKGTEK